MTPEPSNRQEREERLSAVLVACLEAIDGGRRVARDELLALYPEFAAEVAKFLDDQRYVDRFAAPLRAAADIRVPPIPESDGLPGDNIPTRLGDFRLLQEVGRGGMGVVYEAEQISLGRRVALKVLPFAATMDSRALQRFQNEARAAASLHHEHIVPVYAVGCERAVHFYAMQFIEGKTLAAMIADLRSRESEPTTAEAHPTTAYIPDQLATPATDTARQAATATPRDQPSPARYRAMAELCIQAAEALEHAHASGVVHRDVKPANLMIDGRGKLWVADFGLARLAADTGLTMPGDLLGTLRYMSPEQAQARHGLVDHRTDIYALGATLYELLTLRPAVDGSERGEILHNIAFAEPTPLRRWNRAIPTDLETIVLKTLEKNPAGRYATVQELADDLRRFLNDEPIRAHRPSVPQRAAKWVRRHRAVLTALLSTASVALITLVVVLVLFAMGLQTARDKADSARGEMETERDRAKAGWESSDKGWANAESHLKLYREENTKFRRTLYAATIPQSHRAWLDGTPERVLALLDGESCLPGGQDGLDCRGWEWHYLHALCHTDLRTLSAGQALTGVAFSPGGRLLTAGCVDGTVHVWEVASGRETYVLRGHQGAANAVAFRPNGTELASVGMDGVLKLWDWASGKELASLQGPTSKPLFGVAYSGDGKRLAVAGLAGTVTIWDSETRQPLRAAPRHGAIVFGLAFSPDGKQLASGSVNGSVKIWEIESGRLLSTLTTAQTGGHTQMVFNPDGTTLVTGNSLVEVWDVATGKKQADRGMKASSCCVALAPDGRWLATNDRGAVKVWDFATGQELRSYLGHTHRHIAGVAFHPEGRLLASACSDGTVKLWDLNAASQEYRTLDARGGSMTYLAVSPDGRQLASSNHESRDTLSATVKLWDLTTGRLTRVLWRHDYPPSWLAFSPDGQQLAAFAHADVQGSPYAVLVKCWDTTSGREIWTRLEKSEVSIKIAFRPGEKQLALAGTVVAICDTRNGQAMRTLPGEAPDGTTGLAFSSDGRRLLAWNRRAASGTVLDVESGEEGFAFKADNEVFSSPDGRWLAGVNQDNSVIVWDAASGREVFTLRGHTGGINGVAFTPDGRRIVTGSKDGTLRLWELDRGQELLNLPDHLPAGSAGGGVAFSSDGSKLVSGGWLGTIKVREVRMLNPK